MYKAYLKDLQQYQASVQVMIEYRDPALLEHITKTFTYPIDGFTVSQARADVLAFRDNLNDAPNRIEQFRAYIGQEVT